MTLWKFHCMEREWPGLWQRWFMHQCVAVGWPPQAGWTLDGEIRNADKSGWSRARNQLKQIRPRDHVVVSLAGNRIGRIGEITRIAVDDESWAPLVPIDKVNTWGEMGRRVEVRWDLVSGPQDRDMVTRLPEASQFSTNELRQTICPIRSRTMEELREAMADQSNWTGLWDHFDYERALSGYIAAYPHRLADGFSQYPNEKIRERTFEDGKRLDVLLLDENENPVIVECKQGAVTVEAVEQLLNYMRMLTPELNKPPRGILVHGGSRALTAAVKQVLLANPQIQAMRYRLELDFLSSS